MMLRAFFQLIRWKNLLIGIATLVIIKLVLIPKYISLSEFSNSEFILFLVSISLISGAGYAINDVFDIKSDTINKRSKIIVGTSLSIVFTKRLIAILYALGVGLGLYISYKIARPELSIYFVMLSFLLFYYSKKLKSIAIVGNMIVALLISSSIFIIVLFERIEWNSTIFNIILAYSLFAFTLNLIREIVKDIEDVNGDYSVGLKTLPIVFGIKRTNTILIVLSILLAISIVSILVLNKELGTYLFLYGSLFVLLPLVYFVSKLKKAESKQEYSFLSFFLKLIMLLGILSIFTL